MLPRERFINTLLFQPADRIPLVEWPIREATLNEWIGQGYPKRMPSEVFLALDPYCLPVDIDFSMRPGFRERILSKTEEHKIWIDRLGATRKDFLKNREPGFVTRSWLEFAIKDRADFVRMKKRYQSADAGRLPANWAARAETLNNAYVHTQLTIPFLFWTARDWMGFENLCMAFYDQTALVEEMFEFITEFTIGTISRAIDTVGIDVVILNEDMAYKHAPMISPQMFMKFMKPHYIRLVSYLKANGVQAVVVDCDGDPGGLIPCWLDCGVDGVSPCEVAAGNDLLKLRREYPGLAMLGGIDKRALAKDFRAVEEEVMGKVPRLLEKGGYIPHVDHAVPPDVPLANFIHYRKLIVEIAHR